MEVFHRKYRFHFPHPVDIAAMEKAAEYLMGTHDFSAFTDLKEDKDTVRTIYAVGIVYEKDTLTLSWIGDGFLYHMVRILTGTLLYKKHGLKTVPSPVPENQISSGLSLSESPVSLPLLFSRLPHPEAVKCTSPGRYQSAGYQQRKTGFSCKKECGREML